MKNIVILVSLSIFFFGCTKDWGTPATKNYPINGAYTKLDVSNAFEVTVSDQVTDVVVTVCELAHDRVVVRVVDGELRIGFKPNTWYNGKATAVIPANPILNDIDLSGASSFTGDLIGHGVDIDLSGASKYRGFVAADGISLDLSGASVADIQGFCQNKMNIDLSGASILNAANLAATSVFGEMSGASNADVTICSQLNVDLSGASTLTYGTYSDECHPNINCPASGSSVVKPRH
jgi:hypothetical protein